MECLKTAQAPVAFFANGIGDHILAMPSLRALLSLYPRCLSLICSPRMQSVFYSEMPFKTVIQTRITYASDETVGRAFDAEAICSQIEQCDLFRP